MSEAEDSRAKGVKERVDLYRQLRDQLTGEVERYRREGNDRLAKIISDSMAE